MRTKTQNFGFGDQAAGLRKLLARGNAQVITVLGARDGLGATSIVTNLAAVFAHSGKDVLVLDENLSHDNVANTLALRPRFDLLHAARGDKSWQDVLLQGMAGPGVLPVARAMQSLPKMSEAERERLLESLLGAAVGRDVVLVDAARDGNSVCASLSGDEPLLLVLNATASGITDSYALLKKMAMHNGRQAFDIVVNRVGSEREALAVFDNMEKVARHHLQVSLSYLGYIPVDEKLKRATQLCRPVVEAFPSAASSMAMREIAQGLLRAPSVSEHVQDRLSSVMQRLMRMSQPRANNGMRAHAGGMAALT
ncbi:MAG: MinD/ParA family protein [Gammaproteobacteria bacterium]|nr:MinD/ParA family protein [Gammaproteobacteria bacterium]MBU1625523.1 MinD/ParA family protein [Gammaproteobacteria bacterium]MBU1980783.1 MinD/ParA family protein [Gammaproteobacteria bacterium]